MPVPDFTEDELAKIFKTVEDKKWLVSSWEGHEGDTEWMGELLFGFTFSKKWSVGDFLLECEKHFEPDEVPKFEVFESLFCGRPYVAQPLPTASEMPELRLRAVQAEIAQLRLQLGVATLKPSSPAPIFFLF
jgi:hypothetical protein